ncbi:MAG TPA: hypothetical protein VGN42_22770 [Pirellulales bacterium]|jgi:hypothetical protein|nr:hypothetical protein [Pirellulales bacterium]
MTTAILKDRATRPSPWWLVLGLVGLDYFSTLAYLPTIMVEAAGPLAPLAAALLVLVTLLLAVPVYCYVVGRSPDGQGAVGLLERVVHGWRGKLLLLVLMGFVAADFVVTRSLSVADASTHVLHNPHWHAAVNHLAPGDDEVQSSVGPQMWRRLKPMWTRQMALTIGLSLLAFAFLWLLQGGFTRNVLRLAALAVGVYMLLAGIVIASGVRHLAEHPELFAGWRDQVYDHGGGLAAGRALVWRLLLLVLWAFPQLALAISGFELSMTVAPLVKGRLGDDPLAPRGRIRNTRKLMLVAALVMAVYLLGAVLSATILIPAEAIGPGGAAQHRALAYLAHGERLVGGQPGATLNRLFGHEFGSFYDAATVIVLCLAGASGLIALRDLAPQFLYHLGMELEWSLRFRVMMHVFNAIILVVTVVFHASVSAQQGAYATSVLMLLAGAALAATLDLMRRLRGWRLRGLIAAPFAISFAFFLSMAALSMVVNRSGLVIALLFVAAILATSSVSRWMRSTELRFDGFTFADEHSERRWQEILQLDFQVLVPHRPGLFPLADKDRQVRRKHRLPADAYLLFIEVCLGDPSDFHHVPLMKIEREGDLEVIRVSHAVSVAHVLAAIGLEFCRVGRPPEIIFGWSHETPLAANLNFLLFGKGNIPWMVKALVRKAECNSQRRPRIVVG